MEKQGMKLLDLEYALCGIYYWCGKLLVFCQYNGRQLGSVTHCKVGFITLTEFILGNGWRVTCYEVRR
ncbi:hypothetical protein ACHQM5_020903 [Ranunculus cassubicifolius]